VSESASKNQPKRRNKLHDFAAIPQRAAGEKRFRIIHFRVLIAVCRAIDPRTGLSLISQTSIARWANMPRQKVGEPLSDLQDWGYLEKIPRGRRPSGQYLTLQYRVFYSPPKFDHDTRADDSGRVTLGGDKPESPPGVAESDLLKSNLQKKSEPALIGLHDNPAAKKLTNEVYEGTEASTALPSPNGTSSIPSDRTFDSAKAEFRRDVRDLAQQKGNGWELELKRQAEERIFNALSKAFPGEALAAALVAYDNADYDRAVDLEMHKRGAGANYLRRKVKKAVRP
jgi:hypothetical protein